MTDNRHMVKIDYSNYLDSQNEWAQSLTHCARLEEGDKSREYAEIAADALKRVVMLNKRPPVGPKTKP